MRDKKIFSVHRRKTLAFLMGTVYHSHIRNARPNFKSFFGGFFTMIYHSTRNKQLTASSTHAVLQGIAPDGGVIPCQSWLSSQPLGNILADDWDKIWQSERCAAIRAKSAKMEQLCQLRQGNGEEASVC